MQRNLRGNRRNFFKRREVVLDWCRSVSVSRWEGRGASPGVREGVAHVVRTDRDFNTFVPGRILLTRHAAPDLYPAMVRATAAVCETGGLFCHLGVLAREMGTPCVTGAQGILDFVETGTRLRVDGGEGLVEMVGPRTGEAPPVLAKFPTPQSSPASGKLPLVQFGRFSGAFELLEASIDLDTAIRIGALVTIPVALGLGPPWDFEIVGNRVLVDAAAVRGGVDQLVQGLERSQWTATGWQGRADALCRSETWQAIVRPDLDLNSLVSAVDQYIELNQLTWQAVLCKELVAERYRRFLIECLPDLEPRWLSDQFLGTIVLPGHSYIARTASNTTANGTATMTAAERRRRHAFEELTRRLAFEQCATVKHYLETLSALVDLAERKNTDVPRCRRALFGGRQSYQAVIRWIGAGDAAASRGSDCSPHHVAVAVVRRLTDDRS